MMKRNFGVGANSGLGLLGAAPAQLNQGFGGSGGMGQNTQVGMGGNTQMGMGANTQMGMGGRSQMVGASQFRGGVQMGGGGVHGGKGQQKLGAKQRQDTSATSGIRKDPGPNAKNQARSHLVGTSYDAAQMDHGYGEQIRISGGVQPRNIPKRALTAQRLNQKGMPKTATPFASRNAWEKLPVGGNVGHVDMTEGYEEEHGWPASDNSRRPLLGNAPPVAQEAEEYYEEGYTDTWSQPDKRSAEFEETERYPDDQYAETWSHSDRSRKPLLGQAPQHVEETDYYQEEQFGNTWSQHDKERKPLLGKKPQYRKETEEYEQYSDIWPPLEQRRKPLLGETPQYVEKTEKYKEEQYPDTWPPADNRRNPQYAKETQDYQEQYADSRAQLGKRKTPLLGKAPQHAEETQEYYEEQYTSTWPDKDNRQGLLGDAPPFVEEAQDFIDEQYVETRSDRKGLLGDAPDYEETAHEYQDDQYAGPYNNRKGLLGDAPYVDEEKEYQEKPYADTWTPSDSRKGLLGDAPPNVGESQEYEEELYAESWSQSDTKRKPLLGEAPAYKNDGARGYQEKKKALGEKIYQQRRGGGPGSKQSASSFGSQAYTDDGYAASYPEENVSSGMGGMMNTGMQQRTQTGMNQMGLGNRMGIGNQGNQMGLTSQGNQMGLTNQGNQMGLTNQGNQMGLTNQGNQMGLTGQGNQMGLRAGNQMGSEKQYRMGEMERQYSDNRRGSGGSGMGLLGSRPDQGLGGYGDQSDNYMGSTSAQQTRGLLGSQSSMDDNRLSQQERILVQQQQARQLMQQREEQLRTASIMQQQQQQQIQRSLQSAPIMQQRMQQGMMAKSDGLLGEAPATLLASSGKGIGTGRGGTIPSIFDLPGGNRLPSKRQADRVNRTGEKRPRRALSPDRRRGQNRPDTKRDKQDRHQEDRGSEQRKSRFDQSPSQKKDQRQSESRKSMGSRRDDKVDNTNKDKRDSTIGKDKKESIVRDKKDDKVKDTKTTRPVNKPESKSERTVNTKITITIDGDSSASDKYDPADPTGDDDVEIIETADELKMNEEEVMEMISKEDDDVVIVGDEKLDTDSKAKSGTEDTEKDDSLNESNLTVTVTKHKKGRSVNDSDGKPKQEEEKVQYHCNVCNVDCYSDKSFSSHLMGQKHQSKMQTVMAATEVRSQEIVARLKAESHIRKIESESKKVTDRRSQSGKELPVGKALESQCRTCGGKFTGAYRDHKETPEHKDTCPKCNICKQWFKSPRKFVQHCKTDHHVKNKQRHRSKGNEEDLDEMSELVTLDVVGFDDEAAQDDEEAMDVTQDDKSKSTTLDLDPLTPMFSKAQATSTPKVAVKKTEEFKFPEDVHDIPRSYDPKATVGQEYVIPVSGYFCKLCHKFYNNEEAAKRTHCQSEAHFEKYKKAMIVKACKQMQDEEVKDSAKLTVKVSVAGQKFRTEQSSEGQGNKVSESRSTDNSVNGSNLPDQSCATEASSYETADEQHELTLQKVTESSGETLEKSEQKHLVNGKNVNKLQEEGHKDDVDNLNEDDNTESNADSQEDESQDGTVDLTEDKDQSDDVVEIKVREKDTASSRGSRGGSRNKARRARRR